MLFRPLGLRMHPLPLGTFGDFEIILARKLGLAWQRDVLMDELVAPLSQKLPK